VNLADFTWHALYCPPQRELATGHELSSRGFPVVIPAEKDWRDKRGHTREIYRAVLPRYVFTGFRVPPNWEKIRELIPNVQGYMQFGDKGPTVLKLPDIEWLNSLQERLRGRQRPIEDVIKIGDKVRVINGSLEGMSVLVDKIVADRIHTIKSFLGAPRLFKIPLANVERTG
jgi:transcription antitermination factor NusG